MASLSRPGPAPSVVASAAPTLAPAGGEVVVLRATAAEAAGASRRVAGLTVVERAIKQLRRGGHRVVVASDGSVALPPDAGVEVRAVGPGGVDGVVAALGVAPTAVVGGDVVRPGNRELDGGVRVVDDASRRRAEDLIFAELLRGDLGLVARHLNKPVSFRITRHLLCRLPVTPNGVTLGAAVIGLIGCALIASGERALVVGGLLLAHLQSVLDGCDGELARVRFQQSAIGEWLDTLVDDGLNLALMVSVGLGLRATDAPLADAAAVLAFVAAAMMLVYNAVAYRELVRQGDGGEVLKVRWWFTGGAALKQVLGARRGGFGHVLSVIGRRDFFVLAWFVLALAGLLPVVGLYALGVALPTFVVAVGQLVARRR